MVSVRKKDMIKMIANIYNYFIIKINQYSISLTYLSLTTIRIWDFYYMIDGINRNKSDFISIFRLENVLKIMF
jgi:hypothetical protein